MAMLSKAKAAAKPEAEETPTDEAAESPEQQAQEASEGTETSDDTVPSADESASSAPDDESASSAPDDKSAEGEDDSGLSQQQLQEYQRASQLLHTILYQNDKTGRAVLAQIQEQDKVGSIARAAVLVIQQIDKRLNLSDPIIPLMVITVVDRLLEMADRVKKIKYSPQESSAIVSAVTNGVKALFGSQPQQPGAQQSQGVQAGAMPPQTATSASPTPSPDQAPSQTPPQSQGGPVPAGPGLPSAPQPGAAPQPGEEEMQ